VHDHQLILSDTSTCIPITLNCPKSINRCIDISIYRYIDLLMDWEFPAFWIKAAFVMVDGVKLPHSSDPIAPYPIVWERTGVGIPPLSCTDTTISPERLSFFSIGTAVARLVSIGKREGSPQRMVGRCSCETTWPSTFPRPWISEGANDCGVLGRCLASPQRLLIVTTKSNSTDI